MKVGKNRRGATQGKAGGAVRAGGGGAGAATGASALTRSPGFVSVTRTTLMRRAFVTSVGRDCCCASLCPDALLIGVCAVAHTHTVKSAAHCIAGLKCDHFIGHPRPSLKLFIRRDGNPEHRFTFNILKRKIDAMRAPVNCDRMGARRVKSFTDLLKTSTALVKDGDDAALC